MKGIEGIYFLSHLTPQTFASGYICEGNPSLLHRLPENPIIAIKDLTTLLETRRETRAEVFSQLREIYDGFYVKEFGTGKRVEWRGKIGLIAGVTPVIDRYQSMNQIMGERFIQYRIGQGDRSLVGRKAIENTGKEKKFREELASAVSTFLKEISTTPTPEQIGNSEDISHLADFVTRARSSVMRDGYSREVEYIPEPEGPARLAKQLLNLFRGLYILDGKTVSVHPLVYRVAFDSIPKQRLEIIRLLSKVGEIDHSNISKNLNLPKSVIHRLLEELNIFEIIETDKQLWRLREGFKYLVERGLPLSYPPSNVSETVNKEKAESNLRPNPHLDTNGNLVIPFDSDPKYHWWKGGQSLKETLKEVSL